MKYDIFDLLTVINLNPGAPVTQTREPRPATEEPALPEIDYALLAAIARPAGKSRPSLNTQFSTAASANA